MRYVRLYMPNGGNDGVIIASDSRGYKVEFRGRPYHIWDIGEDTPMFHLHSALKTVNISQFQNDEVETVTPWNAEWDEIKRLFNNALLPV